MKYKLIINLILIMSISVYAGSHAPTPKDRVKTLKHNILKQDFLKDEPRTKVLISCLDKVVTNDDFLFCKHKWRLGKDALDKQAYLIRRRTFNHRLLESKPD